MQEEQEEQEELRVVDLLDYTQEVVLLEVLLAEEPQLMLVDMATQKY